MYYVKCLLILRVLSMTAARHILTKHNSATDSFTSFSCFAFVVYFVFFFAVIQFVKKTDINTTEQRIITLTTFRPIDRFATLATVK